MRWFNKDMILKITLYFFILLLPYCGLSGQGIANIKVGVITREFVVAKPFFASCHAATLVECPGNKILAAWFAGSVESAPDVSICLAACNNGIWDQPQIVADGIVNDSLRYACWNPVLFRTKRGLLFLFYKVGKTPREWWGMMKHSDDNGVTWSAAQKLPDGILGPVKNKPLQLKNGSLLYPSSTESMDEKLWQIHMEKSDSKAKHWQNIPLACGSFGVIQPAILSYKNNKLQLLCRSRQNFIIQSWSADGGKTWGPLTKTSLANPNAGIDAVTLRNGLQLLVYNPLDAGSEWVKGRNKLSVAVSSNGIDWKDVITLEYTPAGEYSYPAVIQTRDGLVHILYTYNRKNIRHIVLKLTG